MVIGLGFQDARPHNPGGFYYCDEGHQSEQCKTTPESCQLSAKWQTDLMDA
jgi:hypothetical protein